MHQDAWDAPDCGKHHTTHHEPSCGTSPIQMISYCANAVARGEKVAAIAHSVHAEPRT
jgi:hypothetical protein